MSFLLAIATGLGIYFFLLGQQPKNKVYPKPVRNDKFSEVITGVSYYFSNDNPKCCKFCVLKNRECPIMIFNGERIVNEKVCPIAKEEFLKSLK